MKNPLVPPHKGISLKDNNSLNLIKLKLFRIFEKSKKFEEILLNLKKYQKRGFFMDSDFFSGK